MNSATTGGITVSVETAYIEKDSDPDNQYFVWAYRIKIENNSADTVQLMSRHWIITDALGRQQEVKGAGVVGEQPVLAPGASFRHHAVHPARLGRRQVLPPAPMPPREGSRCTGRDAEHRPGMLRHMGLQAPKGSS